MKMWKWICAAAILGPAMAIAREETWADWRPTTGTAALSADLQPGWAMDAKQRGDYDSPQNVLGPNRGYEGMLVFSPATGAEAPRGPLTVRLLYSVAHPDEINWPGGDRIPGDFVPAPLPHAVPRRTMAEETRMVPAEFPLRIPVVLPQSCGSLAPWRNKNPSALIGRYEVLDADGRSLGRGILPARKLGENARLLMGVVEDDEAMKRMTEKSGTTDRVRDLPDEMAAYRQVRGIWFTEPLWQKMEGREGLLRRLLLSGVQISGETALVERIRTTLGTGWEGQAVAESATPGSWNSNSDFSLRPISEEHWPLKPGQRRATPKPSLLENEANLFQEDLDPYLTWTLASLLVFAAGVAGILAVVFFRHKGERRVAVWWALPAWTALCAAGIWTGGTLFLERRPRADVTEYRLVMAGWPEMHCRAVATAMTFEPGRPEWKLPPSAIVYGRKYGQLDGWWKREDVERSADALRMRLSREPTGTRLEMEAGWFEPASTPVALENGTAEAPGRWIVASEDVDGVYVLAEGKWRALGPMKAGDRLDPLARRILEYNSLPGFPKALSGAFTGYHWGQLCRNPEHHHLPDQKLPMKHDWIVVAVRRDVPPRVAPVGEESLTKGRVIWVMQCP